MPKIQIDWEKLTEKREREFPSVNLTDAIIVPENVLKQFKSTKGLGRSLAARFPNSNGLVRTVDGVTYIVRADLNKVNRKKKS